MLSALLNENFDLLMDAPESVPRMRELILQLAVMGKLVPQDKNDEPASELLVRIKAEKEKLIEEGKIKRPEELPPIAKDEKPFILPDGWEWVRLGSAVTIVRGASPRPKGDRRYFSSLPTDYPWIKISDIRKFRKGRYLSRASEFLTEEGSRLSVHLPAGTLVLTNSATIGVPIILGAAGCIHDGFLAFTHVNEGALDIEYIYEYLRAATGMMILAARGLAQLNINTGIAKNLPFPLPPLAEQKRIVEKVDRLMALCDELEKRQQERDALQISLNGSAFQSLTTSEDKKSFLVNLKRVRDHFDLLVSRPENVKTVRDTILQLAVMGKLVPQDKEDEPAAELLKRIQAEKEKLIEEGKIKRPKELPPISEDEKPFELPDGWEWVRLGEVVERSDYGLSLKAYEDPKGTPFLRMNNIRGGAVVLDDLKFVPAEEVPNELLLKPGDILFNRTNSYELVGKAGLFLEAGTYSFASYLIRVRCIRMFSASYLNLWLRTPSFRTTQIEPEITNMTNQANFNGSKLLNTMVPVAPIVEQERIVARVDGLIALSDGLEEQLASSKGDARRLLESLVTVMAG